MRRDVAGPGVTRGDGVDDGGRDVLGVDHADPLDDAAGLDAASSSVPHEPGEYRRDADAVGRRLLAQRFDDGVLRRRRLRG